VSKPRFSVSEITTFHQSFDEDVESYAKAGADGIGVWEFKLPENRDDAAALAALDAAGLKATTCIPGCLSIFPVPFPGPTDPKERTVELCRAIERFAPFQPEVILTVSGHPGPGADPVESRRVLVDGMRQAAKLAAANGLTIGLEPLHRNVYGTWSTIYSIPDTISVMDEIGEDNVKVLFDVYHLWDTDDVLADIVRHGDRISPSVHICDWRADTRNDFDRALPGEGIMDLPALFGALDKAGAIDWVDLEIFSDDGSFTDRDFEDSLWKQDPADVLARGKAGFEAAWEARTAPA
jgi:sugar phosphate isomerase/epimerase